MNNLLKWFLVLTITVITAFTGISIVKKQSKVNMTFLKKIKTSNALIKTETKQIITPNKARNFLNDIDMPTRDYVDNGYPGQYGRWEADSDKFILESRDSRYQNNLTYSVMGDLDKVNAVAIYLTVNDLSYQTNAINEFIKYSNTLMQKAIGKKLTPEIIKSMKSKTSDEWMINGYKVKLAVDIFPDETIIDGEEPTSDPNAFSLTFLIEF